MATQQRCTGHAQTNAGSRRGVNGVGRLFNGVGAEVVKCYRYSRAVLCSTATAVIREGVYQRNKCLIKSGYAILSNGDVSTHKATARSVRLLLSSSCGKRHCCCSAKVRLYARAAIVLQLGRKARQKKYTLVVPSWYLIIMVLHKYHRYKFDAGQQAPYR